LVTWLSTRSGIVVAMADEAPSRQALELGQVSADLVILTVLPEEYAAASSCLRDVAALRGTHETPNTYAWRLGSIWSSLHDATFSVAVGKGTQTTNYGALAAKQAIQLFSPSYIVFVGVGGGFDLDGQRHGDVAVSSVVHGYEYGKVDTGGFSPRGDFTYRCDAGLVHAAGAVTDATWWREADNPDREPRARTGLIASGDKLIDDPDDVFFAAVRKQWPKILAVEMEGAGVGAAVQDAQAERKAVGFLLVRGISDMPHAKAPGEPASTTERDRWKAIAARNAARFLVHLVDKSWPIPPRGSTRSTTARPASAMDPIAAPDDPVAAWLRFGLQRHGRVMVVGFRDASIPIDLDRVFVPLYVYADRARTGGPDPREDKDGLGHGGAEISFDDALARASDALARVRDGRTCLALIGDPGAGKTTLLRHLFRRVASGAVTGPVAHLRGLHPVLVRLATVTDDELVARGLARIVARVAAEEGYPQAGPALLGRPGQLFLFLLDGLDEVRDESTRERVCAWLNHEIDHWPGCAFVVTSRRAAWARTPVLGARFLPVSVQGLRGDAIAEYVGRWFHAVVRHFHMAVDPPEVIETLANQKTAALLEVLATPTWRSSTRLLEMTANPLMLSTLCLAHYNDTRLPDQRGELYERTLGLLIEVWTRERPGGPALRLETARLVLQPLAYAMHEQDRRELAIDEAAALVKTPLSQVPALRVVAPTPERFLDLVRDECGVLMSRDLGRIEFIHLSFQEYLAACHVAGLGLGPALADRAGAPRWEEVILLAMSRPGVFAPFMTRALERGDLDPALLRQCLRETLQILPAPFEAAADRALARLRTPDGPLAAGELRRLFELVQGYDLPGLVERARSVLDSDDRALRAAARKLVGLEDTTDTVPREGHPFVEPATGMTFVWIPGGSFLMGSSKKSGQPNYDPGAHDDEVPAHRVQISGFWMSVYPVTNEQYARFVAETAHAAPESFTDRRFNDPAQPVVTVSWDDARAFTAWLTAKLAGLVARLPTEAEWEYAARGTDGRRFPWGNEPPLDASRATFGQQYDTRRPAMVGHTPDGKSPFGVHDLAGNVWEWCLDVWADSYAEIQAGYWSRVVRGGSWDLGARLLRSAFRGRRDHGYRDWSLGFRVVCGGASQPDAH
jgi:formylglycine-generating enzyme required for sulfatase activity/nucleoside phosphorylase